MPAMAHVDPSDRSGVARVGDVDDGRAGGRPHVADIKGGTLHPDLAAARAVNVGTSFVFD